MVAVLPGPLKSRHDVVTNLKRNTRTFCVVENVGVDGVVVDCTSVGGVNVSIHDLDQTEPGFLNPSDFF